jgi:hypothetical protein
MQLEPPNEQVEREPMSPLMAITLEQLDVAVQMQLRSIVQAAIVGEHREGWTFNAAARCWQRPKPQVEVVK